VVLKIKKLHPDAITPRYAHGPDQDAGMDLHSVEDVVLRPGVPTLVKTGLAFELPLGLRGRSDLAVA
jgi:dUTP pyrophosphatase